MPYRILDEADHVVLVDITPELLIEPLRARKISAPTWPRRASFQPEKLATLRDVSPLQTVQEMGVPLAVAGGPASGPPSRHGSTRS